MKKGYVIPHTHWDREWRYPIWENRMYLVELVDELLDILDKDMEYQSFLFDGQTVSLLDYLEVRPENTERLKKHVQDGRLLVGPWYTLPDLYPVNGESLVRNLLKGTRVAGKLGRCMLVGYESFGWGQTAQFPQIYKGFNIDTVFVAKNVDKTRAKNCEFIWKGADGTEVLATRLGEDARANFFMNATLQITNNMPYKSDEYRYSNGKQGMVYHQADKNTHGQDYFLMEYNGKIIEDSVVAPFMAAWDGMKDTLLPEHRALMNGSDSTSAQPLMTDMIKKINRDLAKEKIDIAIESSSIEDYVKLLKTIDRESLATIEGELRDGPATSLSANALMTRPGIKILNKTVQNILYRCAEPFSTVTNTLGCRYDSTFLDKAMDYLLLSHPHDSINGVTQDKTVEDVLYRLNQSLEISQTIYNTCCKNMLRHVNTEVFEDGDILIAVFNPLPFPASDQISVFLDTPAEKTIWDFTIQDEKGTACDCEHLSRKEVVVPVSDLHARPWPYYADRHEICMDVRDVPAGGYRIYRVVPGSTFNRNAEYWPLTRKTRGGELSCTGNSMENEFLHVTVNPNGTLTILDKKTHTKYCGLNYFEDEGDCGDYWIYYPPYENRKYTSLGQNAQIWVEKDHALSCTIAAKIRMQIPEDASRHMNGIKGESKRSDRMTEIAITSYYTLKKGGQQVEVNLIVDNTASDHRFKVLFDTGISCENVYAQGHFNVDKRPVLPLKDSNGFYYNELTTQPMQNFVDVTDGRIGFGIITDSLGEYEMQDNTEGTLALTLFRAVRNIICTEMRSGGHFPDQHGGQCLGQLNYHYAICPHAGDYKEGGLYEKANQFNAPLKAVQTCKQMESGNLPTEHGFYRLSGNLELSALKQCEDSEDFILRVYNPYNQWEEGVFEFHQPIKEAHIVNLNEEETGITEVTKGTIHLELTPNQITTIKFNIQEI